MSKTLKKHARRLARKGRHGDTKLMHVREDELETLSRRGYLTRNPDTGLPEAFSMPSFSDVRNFAEATFGGSAVGGPVGAFAGGFNDIQNPGGSVDTALRDVGGAAMLAGGAFLGGEAMGMPMWGSTGAETGATPFYGDMAADPMAGFPGGMSAAEEAPWYTPPGDVMGGGGGGAAPWSGKDYLLAGLGGTQVATGAYGLYNAYQGRQAQKAQQRQQQEYYDRLNALMANPESIRTQPGYQFGLEQGNEALARRMASMGYGTSGNLAVATQQYGTDYALKALDLQEQLLASQYGRAAPPTQTMPDPTSLAMNSLSNMGYGFSPFLYSGR